MKYRELKTMISGAAHEEAADAAAHGRAVQGSAIAPVASIALWPPSPYHTSAIRTEPHAMNRDDS